MVQQPRQEEPLYSCTVPVESLTGRLEEEAIAFGASEDIARQQAKSLLAENYNCSQTQIRQLMQQAQVVPLSPWCAPPDQRRAGGNGEAGGEEL